MRKRLHFSLTTEIILCFVLLTSLIIGLVIVGNNVFLNRYYIQQKQDALESAYASIDEAAGSNSITSRDFNAELIRISSRDNLGVIVMNEESQAVKYYASDAETMIRRMWDNLLETTDDLPENFDPEGEDSWVNEKGQDEDYFTVKKFTETDSLHIQIVLDKKTNTQYLERWGILSDGSYYLLRTGLDSIRNNSMIANRFFAYLAVFALLVGCVMSIVLGRQIARPIREITGISQRMRGLDFSAKYQGNARADEINELGSNINELSTALEKTISELKTANNQLKEDLEQRDRNEAMQREFISNVTHELKTPIALIQGYAEGLQDGITDDQESRDYYTGVIVDEAGKMNRMVQKLLSLMHLEFGQVEVTMERFDVVEEITNYLSSANLLADRKDVRVSISETDREGRTPGSKERANLKPIYVWSDAFLTEEVFQNYFTNALNHVEPAGSDQADKVVDIRFEQKENCCRISVFNTGKPIPDESLDRIWDKFYKVDKARTREYGGSGVGLSIVRAIMERLHQPYGVLNYDNGVKFWFELDTNAQASGGADGSGD